MRDAMKSGTKDWKRDWTGRRILKHCSAQHRDLDDKTDVLTYIRNYSKAQKEKEDLKAKVEKWHNSSKNLSKLLNTQMSANDKFGLGYGDHRYDGILSYENEVLQSVFMNKESDIENQPLYDRFVTAEGMHAVPPPMTGNYMPSGPEIENINLRLSDAPMHEGWPFKKTTVLRTKFSNQKLNTAKVNGVSTVGGKRETAVKRYPQQDYPHRALKNKGILHGCSRHMTGNKAYLAIAFHRL
ncbi:hypothetical protein Tco_0625103 [Tanacetum coccineum]|uniref:Uncharacterized protein n=1 Tax=Tanacetum coccineum TaxID=301880 RepID=A0ABQ4WFU8_9ASTR